MNDGAPSTPIHPAVYKIFLPEQFASFQSSGEFFGSPDDERDGYIHLSLASQVPGTIKKHFSKSGGLVIAELSSSALGPALRFEMSRERQLYPHYYGSLKIEAFLRCVPISDFEGGEEE